MPKPNGPQFIRLYRGLVAHHEHLDPNLGSHWTPDYTVAYNFATSRDAEGYPIDNDYEFSNDDFSGSGKGTILEADVHKRHIIDPGTEEHENWRDMMGVLGPESHEQERTVRPGAPVHLRSITQVNEHKGVEREVKRFPVSRRSIGRA